MPTVVIYYRGLDYEDTSELSEISGIKLEKIVKCIEDAKGDLVKIQKSFNGLVVSKRKGYDAVEEINEIMGWEFNSLYEFRDWFIKCLNFDIVPYCSLLSKVDVARLYAISKEKGHTWLFNNNESFDYNGRKFYSVKSFFTYNRIHVKDFMNLYIHTKGNLSLSVEMTKDTAHSVSPLERVDYYATTPIQTNQRII